MTALRLLLCTARNANTLCYVQRQQFWWRSAATTNLFTRNRYSDGDAGRFNSFSRSHAAILQPPCVGLLPYPGVNNCCHFGTKSSPDRATKSDSKSASITEKDLSGAVAGQSLLTRFKLMYKQYWYVLIPVHVVTSLGWIGGFYYLSKCGVDLPALLQYIHLSESIIQKMQSSDVTHFAIAYICYKVITPLRYAVTLGGTTISIKYLLQAGYLKPVPTKKELMRMYEEKKAHRAAAKADKKAQQDQQAQK